MSPDPFRRLDGIDPPERWDAIAERAAHPDELVVDIDDRRSRSRRRATGVVVAAAVLALVLGAIAALPSDDTGLQTTATGGAARAHDTLGSGSASGDGGSPTGGEPTGAEPVTGPCPFDLSGDPTLPPPVGVPDEDADVPATTMPGTTSTWGRVDVDGTTVRVGVGGRSGGGGPILGPVGTRDVQVASVETTPSGGAAHVTGLAAIGDVAPCTDATVFVSVPLDPADVAAARDGTLDLATYVESARPLVERVLDAVRLRAEGEAPRARDEADGLHHCPGDPARSSDDCRDAATATSTDATPGTEGPEPTSSVRAPG